MSKKKRRKRNTVYALIGCLAVLAVASVSVATVTVLSEKDSRNDSDSQTVSENEDITELDLEINAEADEVSSEDSIDLTALQPDIEAIISDIQNEAGGEWSAYITIPKTGDTISINQQKMQAASVIKLFVMGAVYEQYDEIKEAYPYNDVDGLIESMITISDNEATDLLVCMLGRGDNAEGRAVVNAFCEKYGFENTSMDRMMGDDNIYSDNYTTTEDSAKILQMMYEGKFEHSKEMLDYLSAQTRTLKIPEGVPDSVRTANKTGELDDVQNDSAIVFTKYPYIISVMSDGVWAYQEQIDVIVDISKLTYEYIAAEESEYVVQ